MLLYYSPPQAKEKQAQLEHDKLQEEDDNFTEVCNHVNGDLLTENPDVAQSAFGPHRVIPDRWKGMSPSQLEEIRKTQEFQRQEKEVCDSHLVMYCMCPHAHKISSYIVSPPHPWV